MFPVSHAPSSGVAVCGAESAFVQAIVSPTAAVTSGGSNAKFWIFTVTAAASLEVLQPPPPAAGALAAGSLAPAGVGAVLSVSVAPSWAVRARRQRKEREQGEREDGQSAHGVILLGRGRSRVRS